MKSRNFSLTLLLLLVAYPACKRQKLELDPGLSNSQNPTTTNVQSIKDLNRTSIVGEKTENARHLEEIDARIEELNQKLANSALSSGEKSKLADELAQQQKVLEELQKRNKELEQELKNAMNNGPSGQENPSTRTPMQPSTGMTSPDPMKPGTAEPEKFAQIGPYAFTKAEQCMSVAQKSTSDKAPLEAMTCTWDDNQLFTLEEANDQGEFRLIAQHSQKCLTLSGTGLKVGDKLQQTPCERKPSSLGERFFLIGINDYDIVLQSSQTEMCIVIQGDGSLVQDKCTDSTTYYRLRKKPMK